MAVAVALTPFAEWLERAMRLHGFGENQSKLATYLGTGSSTVNAWFTRGTIPGPEMCHKLADVLKVPPSEVLQAAGHVVGPTADPGIPEWLISLAPLLTDFDAYERHSLEASVLQLRELRTYRAEREATPAEDPEPPRQP